MGWDTIRLGVVWAGAQPRDENALDSDFERRLHAILDLTDKNGINVILDNHGDMVGTANCGNGMPMWIQKKAAPHLIGRPLTTGFPYSLIDGLNIEKEYGYSHCGKDSSKWRQYAGDPNYNLLNECCQHLNSDQGGKINPPATGYTKSAQATMSYIMQDGQGRKEFVRFWALIARAVVNHPSAFAFELMNEPMYIRRGQMFETWKACAEVITSLIPDASVAIADTGEGAVLPSWASAIGPGIGIDNSTVNWIKKSNNVFYPWHWYGYPSDINEAVKSVQAISVRWHVPTFLTEFNDCRAWRAVKNANIGVSYWHYSSYCNTGAAFGWPKVPENSFGACILGWGGGDSSKRC